MVGKDKEYIIKECLEKFAVLKERRADKAGHMVEKLFHMLAEASPQAATRWLECADKILWDNYITEEEAQKISQSMRNSDGTKGFFWTLGEVKSCLKEHGIAEEEDMRYNFPALAASVNMCWSDHSETLCSLAGVKDKSVMKKEMLLPCCRMALELLNDDDGVFSIRKYFSDVIGCDRI